MTTELLLRLGGLLHFVILIASALTPRVLDWRAALAPLSAFMRCLVWVYGAFIVLVIAGFGVLSVLHAGALAEHTPLARFVCTFIALFWLCRLIVQLFIFDTRAILRGPWLKAGYHALTAAFVILVFVYGWAAY